MPVIGPNDFPPVPIPGAYCAWTVDVGCCPEWATFPADVQERAVAYATGILDAFTGRRFAQCPIKLRPCGKKCGILNGYMVWPVGSPASAGSGQPWMIPYVDNGVWRNCGCRGGCSCRATCEARLPMPVAEIIEVVVDGLTLDPSAYRVDNNRTLVRIDGECWPECQNMDLPDTDMDTWSVTLSPGDVLPRIGEIAAGELACEFARACVGDTNCQLPQQLQSLTRNGVQVEMVDPNQLLDNGLTGFVNVDTFIRAVNPHRLIQRPRVLSPDLPRDRQVQF